jgi:hypothetical protein
MQALLLIQHFKGSIHRFSLFVKRTVIPETQNRQCRISYNMIEGDRHKEGNHHENRQTEYKEGESDH